MFKQSWEKKKMQSNVRLLQIWWLYSSCIIEWLLENKVNNVKSPSDPR